MKYLILIFLCSCSFKQGMHQSRKFKTIAKFTYTCFSYLDETLYSDSDFLVTNQVFKTRYNYSKSTVYKDVDTIYEYEEGFYMDKEKKGIEITDGILFLNKNYYSDTTTTVKKNYLKINTIQDLLDNEYKIIKDTIIEINDNEYDCFGLQRTYNSNYYFETLYYVNKEDGLIISKQMIKKVGEVIKVYNIMKINEVTKVDKLPIVLESPDEDFLIPEYYE